jgi:hypothetical protein
MGLFGKEQIEKVECESCGKSTFDDQVDENGLCDECENKVQCTDCEKWFDNTDEHDRCKVCAAKVKEEEYAEEEDCSECSNTFTKGEMVENEDTYYCKPCWKKLEDNRLTIVTIFSQAKVLKIRSPKTVAEEVYRDIVNKLKSDEKYTELTNNNSKTTLKLSEVYRVDIDYDDEQFDPDEDYSDEE